MTLHCDIGCDNYDVVPVDDPRNKLRGCEVPGAELRQAKLQFQWWKDMLGPHYPAFFNENTNSPNPRLFKKIQHLQVWDSILKRYPDLKVIWAHVGLSKELKNFHPLVHKHILETFFERYPNLHADVSWDVLPKMVLMNFKEGNTATRFEHHMHEDFHSTAADLFNKTAVTKMRQMLHDDVWVDEQDEHAVSGSQGGAIGGPTYAMAIYLKTVNKYPDRFITGTDFVASYGSAKKYPGLQKYKYPASGCVKDVANHARQYTDTSSINMFFENEAFRKIVLGENYFRLAGIDDKFAPPPICGDDSGSGVSGLSEGAIIGIVVGAVIALIIIILIIGFLIYKAKKQST